MTALYRILFLWVFAGAGHSAFAATPNDPEVEYRELLALSKAQIPSSVRLNDEAAITWFQKRNGELQTRGAAFRAAHPAHPLRWDVLVLLQYGGEQRVKVGSRGSRTLVPVPESKAAWDKRYYADLESLLAAPEASVSARGEALRQLISHTARSALAVPGQAKDAARRVGQWLEVYEREYPRSGYIVWLYQGYTDLLDALDPALCVKFLAELEPRYRGAANLDSRVREMIAGHRRALEAQAMPMDDLWKKLKEMDSVRGDGAQYRNKVVLVAFGPVVYDTFMESLEDLHAEFSGRGLVILQVASFNRNYGLPPEPEQRRRLEELLAARKWPWPVLWNPRSHMELVSLWGYNSIPAHMLIGRDGRLVSNRGTPYSISIARELARAPEAP